MLLALGIIAAVSGTLTYFFLNNSKKSPPIQQNYTSKPYEYKGVRKHDFIKERVMFYPYNYVNG
jgi:hypothetical protein